MNPNDPNYFSNSQNYPKTQNYPQDYPSFHSFLNTSYFPNSRDHSSSQYQQNSFSPNLNQTPIFEETQPSQNISRNLFEDVQHTTTTTNQKPQKNVWSVKEDVALMSSWCFVSEDNARGKNQKGASLWARVHKMFHTIREENPEQQLGDRNVDSIKGRWSRLNANANKWIGAYKEAYGRKRSGMSKADIENEAHAIYEESGCKFQDLVVFNEVMSKHPKWDLTLDRDATRSRPEDEEINEESGGSSKRSRTSEDGDYYASSQIPQATETPSSGHSQIPRPMGRDKAKKKGKGKASQSSSTNEIAEEIRAMRLTRVNELEVMNQLTDARIDLENRKLQRKSIKMKEKMLNTLLAKDHLSPEDEEMKRRLMAIVFGE